MPPEPTASRLKRILVLVPWVIANEGARVEEVCARFGISEEELAQDLQLLIVCGLPPFGPGDLIWAEMEEGHVSIEMADYLARPPRLTREEALALLIMGRAVAALPGMEEAEALRSALEKLNRAVAPAQAGEARELAGRVEVELEPAGAQLLGQIRGAIADRARLRISYFSRGRGAMTDRVIDPLVVYGAAGYWYLRAHDHESGEERVFRIDRIRDLAPTADTFEERAQPQDPNPLFTPSAHDLTVIVETDREAAWLAEAVVADRVVELADGRRRIHLRTPHLSWLVNLLLSVGGPARAIEPPELVEAVRAEAGRALARYSG